MIKQQKDGLISGTPKARIFPFCLGMAIFFAALTAGCSQNRSGLDESEAAAMREVRELAGAAALLLNVYMDARVTEMLMGSKTGGPLKDALTMPEIRADANAILRDWLKVAVAYEAILLLDKNGICLASAPAGLVNRDFSNDEAFQGAVKGQLTITDAHKSEVLISLDPKSKGWTAVIAVPVVAENGTAGVLMAFLNWSRLRMTVLGVHVGRFGYVYVVNRKRQVIIHPGGEDYYGLSLRDPKTNHPEVDEAIARRAQNCVYEIGAIPLNMATRFEGYAYPRGYRNFPGLGWTVCAHALEREIVAWDPILRWFFRWAPQKLDDNTRKVPGSSFKSP
jgi:Cache domain